MQILIWALAAVALGFWTLLAWATAWVLGLDPSVIGNLATRIGDMPGAAWLELWLPGWEPVAVATLELTRDLFAALGTVGVVLVWALWGVGALVIVAGTAVLSFVLRAVRRRTAPAVAGVAR